MVKRLMDVLLVILAFCLLWPLILGVALMVRWKLGTPVLFNQTRPGYLGKPFNIYKFRSMTDARSADGALLPDEIRLTRFGRLLRSTSLDELPNLWVIFKGDMSLVGPRPLLMEYLPLYNAQQARRHLVKPGLTGWAQVNGRNAISWQEKFALDAWYVDHQSLWLDIKIILLTIKKICVREGISAKGEATMPKFTGNDA
ncbi:sugar transferase [Methylophilus sp. TWE2]|uniref:sugar transferase n=1 Tax=Methylophilus sp. TWE2 TaxID=1662285 RepID=UPI000670AB38|nr:sugar transferase [Methylophilus sp. TWE2]AKR43503.1 sugar transferase [Methylophilus sp. TWE2]